MDNKPSQFIVSPGLSEEENNLILLLRTLRTGIVKIPVAYGKPTSMDLRWPDLVNWPDIYTGELSHREREVLACIYNLEFGDLYLNILDLGKFQILSDTVQRIRLRGIDWGKRIHRT